ncbi:MAG: hypothetical protein R2848_01155 [Thermomicrobiales bacterium]
MLVATRQVLIVFATITFAIAFWFALRLLGLPEVVLGFLLIALEPFGIGLGKLLHVDAMAALFFLLAMVTMLVYHCHRGRSRWILLAGAVASALAILTRANRGAHPHLRGAPAALAHGPTAQTHSAAVASARGQARLANARLGRGLAGHGAHSLAGTRHRAARGSSAACSLSPKPPRSPGTSEVIYFDGELFTGDPGYRFYPVAFLWRVTPALAGLVLAVALVVWGAVGESRARNDRSCSGC